MRRIGDLISANSQDVETEPDAWAYFECIAIFYINIPKPTMKNRNLFPDFHGRNTNNNIKLRDKLRRLGCFRLSALNVILKRRIHYGITCLAIEFL